MNAATERLRQILKGSELLLMPCCFDALSARLVEQAGFPLTFMSADLDFFDQNDTRFWTL